MQSIDSRHAGARAVAADSRSEIGRDLPPDHAETQAFGEELAALRARVAAHDTELSLSRELIAREARKRRELGRALGAFFVRFERRIDALHNRLKATESEELIRRRTWDALTTAFQHLARLLRSESPGD